VLCDKTFSHISAHCDLYFCINDSYALCITPRYIEIFSDLYDSNSDENLTAEEKALLFTSMVVQPESLMLKVCYRIYHSELQISVYIA